MLNNIYSRSTKHTTDELIDEEKCLLGQLTAVYWLTADGLETIFCHHVTVYADGLELWNAEMDECVKLSFLYFPKISVGAR